MLSNFIRLAVRNLLKNRLYSLINISGLAIGVACSILIVLWVQNELEYDKFIPKHDKIFQVWLNADFDGKINSWRSVPLPAYEAMKDVDGNIVNSAVAGWGFEHLLAVGEKRLLQDGYYVSKEFLDMLEFPMVQGDGSVALDDPPSIVISEALANSLFGDEEPMGKIIRLDDEHDLTVTGVLKDVPKNSSFQFEYLIPWKFREQTQQWVRDNLDNWGNNSFQIFVELQDPSLAAQTQTAIEPMLEEHDQMDPPKKFFLHPMNDWRLNSTFENGKASGGMIDYVRLFSVIAIFVLLIACINFMNLSTARSERRAKEVGIRKTVGSTRFELIFQFLGESLLIATVSLIFGILITELALPFYNDLVNKELFIDYTSPQFYLFGVSLILLTGLISGSYPAFYLSSFRPAQTLKGKINTGRGGSTPRKVLVVLQFAFSIFLMLGTVVIYQQIEMVRDRELGYDQENLISVDFTDEVREKYDLIKQDLLNSGAVESVTQSNSQITQINSNNFLGWPGKPEELRVIFTTITCNYDYAKTMGIKMLMGRDFSEDFKSDTAAIVINKAALDLMGLEEPIGAELDLWGTKRTLIGVMDNALMGSVYEEVKPLFTIIDDWGGYVSIRLKEGQDVQSSLAAVSEVFTKHNPAYPFDYRFMDVEFQQKFETINMTQSLASLFSVLAILITGLGLFGLASFMAEQRTKEIGIRKVMGASVTGLVSLMSRDFSRLVIISFIISAPLGWWLLDGYLDRYPLRITIDWWIYPLVGIIALTFALLIVANQAYKAAQANPVNSLRND